MSLWKQLFGGGFSPEPETEKGRASADKVAKIIGEIGSNFNRGQGMVLVLQEGLRVRVYSFNGVPRCSWIYTNKVLSLDWVGEKFLEGPPVEIQLRERDIKQLVKTLQTEFGHCEISVQPLWHLDRNAWDYEMMRSLHEYDFGIRISFQ